ncbi:MAG: phage head-tail connector protein [Chordicoccus sp.]
MEAGKAYDQVLSLLGLKEVELTDMARDQITTIIDLVSDRLLGILSSMMGRRPSMVPDELSGVVIEVSVNRYNRIGSEGASGHTVEGETTSWFSSDYFTPYMDEIRRYVSSQGKTMGVKFL